MTVTTPMQKILRLGKEIFIVYPSGQATKISQSDTPEHATWIANAIAGYHKVSLEEREE